MPTTRRQNGISLTEILVVAGIIAILMGISIPAARSLMDSYESTAGVRKLINSAMSNARAIAVREQTYAGIRFQPDMNGHTYMIFIVHDPAATGLANGFRALTGRRPMKLPDDVGAVCSYWIKRADFYTTYDWNKLMPVKLDDAVLTDNAANLAPVGTGGVNRCLLDASTFSIIFSPQGRLTVHPVWVRNKDGTTDGSSNDTIFNVLVKVQAGISQFLQDDYGLDPTNCGVGPEISVQSFKLYSKSDYKQANAAARWTSYLQTINDEHISPYTGELVLKYREQNP
ncbi:MAG TPA: prepilin-type N-terminal cleavage/methylation domain-containing protein [Anaerohalosphaeraceae bacterium]|nr:prepilin-type N-terminal cleavage/methylation domain-containing protein [Phycisphaerae bacterium]HOK96898.1 prepilin-type N-terminal cleavage/methylation domain-containing protein [Anaerohalosphaeraceae bacterium]HOL31159.1 prepilin-type N-terminal cleavage/methylation domain-containing protein [Anaerohalosphaeraceae bacterium]HOM75854.1 prepilin-type N-terminal cleavage/methylation domain-containing protein [Anaerohalosphaeraceae bacterium]HPC63486.1 prepilin-type N-terminal cleavage/methyl